MKSQPIGLSVAPSIDTLYCTEERINFRISVLNGGEQMFYYRIFTLDGEILDPKFHKINDSKDVNFILKMEGRGIYKGLEPYFDFKLYDETKQIILDSVRGRYQIIQCDSVEKIPQLD